MYSITFPDVNRLKNFLSVNNSEFVDALFRDNSVFLVADTNEVFTCIELPASRSKSQENFECRIYSKLLQSVAEQTVLIVNEKENTVAIEFRHESGAMYYSCEFKKQVVLSTAYYNKLKVVQTCDSDVYVDTDQFYTLAKIAKMFNSFVVVDLGVACVSLRSGPRVYKKLSTQQQFSITGDAVIALRKCNNQVVNVQEYLFARNEEFTVLVKKAVASSNEEYRMISGKQFGSKCIFQLNVGNLLQFFARTRIKLDSVTIEVNNQLVHVEAFNSDFSVPVEISGMQVAEGAEPDNFMMPSSVLFGIMNILGKTEFMVKQKRSFIQFEHEDYTIVW